MKTYQIMLDDATAHRLEIRAAIDDLTPEQGIQELLTHIICEFEESRK